MGSSTGAVSDLSPKMRLTPLLALIFLSCLLVNLINARHSRSSHNSRNCKGSSSRPRGGGGSGSTRCRPTTVRTTTKTTQTSNSNGITTRENTRSTLRPSFQLPERRKPAISSVSPDDEGNDSVSTRKKIKTSAKKYFQKVKDKLKSATTWYVDNKDKTIDEILVERWKEKGECSGADSNKEKRKSCVSAALAESEEDTPGEKKVKEALKILLEEDSDGVYEFLSSSSSKTFQDIENEEEIQDKLTSRSGSDSNNFGDTQLPRSTLRPSFQLPKRKGPAISSVSQNDEENDSVSPTAHSGSSSDSDNFGGTRKTIKSTLRPSFQLPKRKGSAISSVSATDEENNSLSTRKKIKTSAKKYFQKVKDKLKSATTWYVDNKDKTIDEILVERWKEKGECSGADSNKEKRKSCVSAALAESEEDTPGEKKV